MNFDHQAQTTPAPGTEPPSAPLHIIAYVDGRMREHTQHVEQILREHITDEMLRFGAGEKGGHQNAIGMSVSAAARSRRAVDDLRLSLTC